MGAGGLSAARVRSSEVRNVANHRTQAEVGRRLFATGRRSVGPGRWREWRERRRGEGAGAGGGTSQRRSVTVRRASEYRRRARRLLERDQGHRRTRRGVRRPKYHVLDAAANHVTAGVQGEISLVSPFTSRGGGTLGFNLQLNMDALHDSGLFFYYTPADSVSDGLAPGGDFGFNLAYGRAAWRGPFDNTAGSLWLVGGSVFRSPGWNGSGPGYAGVSVSLSAGAPIGFAQYRTNYVPIFGD